MKPVLLYAALLTAAGGPAAPDDGEPRAARKVLSAAFSPDGKTLGTVWDDRVVRVWDVVTGKEGKPLPVSLEKDDRPKQVFYPPAGEAAVVVYRYAGFRYGPNPVQGTISAAVWTAGNGKLSPFIEVGYGGLGVCPKGERLAYETGVWEVATGKKVLTLGRPGGLAYDIGFSPDGKLLAYHLCDSLAQDQGIIVLRAAATGAKVLQVGAFDRKLTGGFRTAPVFAPDGKTFAFCGPDPAEAHVWSVGTDRLVRSVKDKEFPTPVGFARGGKVLVTCQGTTIKLWDVATGRGIRAVEVGGKVSRVFVSPNGRTAAVIEGEAVTFRDLGE